MPANLPRLVSLTKFLGSRGVRGKPPLVFLTNGETKKFLKSAVEVTRLPKGPSLRLTPWPPDGAILRPCASTEENVVCIPIVRWTPMGPTFVCRCHRLPSDDGGDSGGGVITPPRIPCQLIIDSSGAPRCMGQCARGSTCTLVYRRNPLTGDLLFACICRSSA